VVRKCSLIFNSATSNATTVQIIAEKLQLQNYVHV